MKKLLVQIVAVFCLSTSFLFGVIYPGDSYEKMREELGEPTGQIKKGNATAYSFPQGVIYVENGRVVKVSEGFYGKVDQITRQTATGTYERKVGEGLFDGPDAPAEEAVAGEAVFEEPALKPAEWMSSYEQAKKVSEEELYPMLILFTTTADCNDCRELEELILQDPKFKEFTQRGIVLLRLEYPVENPSEALLSLKEAFSIESFPMMVVLDPEGNELGRLDYKYLPPEAYVIMLDQILLDGGESAEQVGMDILREEFGDAVDRLMFVDSISGSGLMLSAQIFVGCILAFLLIRRLMKK